MNHHDQLNQQNIFPIALETNRVPYKAVEGARFSRESENFVHLPIVDGEDADLFRRSKVPAAYHVGVVAVRSDIHMPGVYRGARRLRLNEYSGRGWLHPNAANIDGGEFDEYDNRALHIAVTKNTPGGPVLIATDRLILKDTVDNLLPVEKKFPEIFENNPAQVGATEISRHMSRSANKTERALAEIASMRAMIGVGLGMGFTHAYGMIEKPLARLLSIKNLAHNMLTSFEPTPEYGNTLNGLLHVEPHELLKGVRFCNVLRKKDPVKFSTYLMFNGADKNQGIGFYGPGLLVNLGKWGVGREIVHSGGVEEELRRYVSDKNVIPKADAPRRALSQLAPSAIAASIM